MIKKIGVLIVTIILTTIIAVVYGIIHDQLTYSISQEYFTKFKFEQFGFWDYAFENNNREKVAFIGAFATLWFGVLIGIVNGIVGLIQPNSKIMWKSVSGATIRTLAVTVGMGIIGLLVGEFIIANLNLNWNVPDNLINQKSFLTVGTIHNLGYFGGLIGLITGVIYQIKIKKASVQQRL